MRISVKKAFSLIATSLILLSCCLNIYAQTPPTEEAPTIIEQIITRTEVLSPDGLCSTVTFSNIQQYVDYIHQNHPDIPDEEIAQEILDFCGYNDFRQSLQGNRLLEVLSYKSITRSAEYVHLSPCNAVETITEQEALRSSAEILTCSSMLSPLGSSVNDSFVSDDGYMNLATYASVIDAPITDTNPNHSYYMASAFSNWLIFPVQRYEDVLALSCGNAIFDMTFDNYAYALQFDRCGYTDCNTAQREQWSQYALSGYDSFSSTRHDAGYTTYGTYDPENHITLLYPASTAGAARVNYVGKLFECLHEPSTGHLNCYVENITMSAGVCARVYLQNGFDTNFQAAYSHKWTGIGNISVSIGADLGISFSSFSSRTDYFARPITVQF